MAEIIILTILISVVLLGLVGSVIFFFTKKSGCLTSVVLIVLIILLIKASEWINFPDFDVVKVQSEMKPILDSTFTLLYKYESPQQIKDNNLLSPYKEIAQKEKDIRNLRNEADAKFQRITPGTVIWKKNFGPHRPVGPMKSVEKLRKKANKLESGLIKEKRKIALEKGGISENPEVNKLWENYLRLQTKVDSIKNQKVLYQSDFKGKLFTSIKNAGWICFVIFIFGAMVSIAVTLDNK